MRLHAALWLSIVGATTLGCNSQSATKVNPTDEIRGVQLRVAITKGSALADALSIHLTDFEAKTGASVTVDAGEKIDRSADVCIVTGDELATLSGLTPISHDTIEHAEMRYHELPATYRLVFNKRGRDTVAVPIGVDLMLLWYRTDLFKDDSVAAAYRDKTGEELRPPETWLEYLRVAEFFTDHPAVRYGCVEATDGSDEAVRCFFAHCAAYAKSPHQSSFSIDSETGKSRLAGPGMVQGMNVWLEALQYSPATADKPIDAAQARRLFVSGEAAMLLDHVVPTVAADDSHVESSAYLDKIGVARLPGAIAAAGEIDAAGTNGRPANRCTHYATTGTYVILGSPSNRDAAEQLLRFLSDAEHCFYLVIAGRRGLLPIRTQLLLEPHRFRAFRLPDTTVRRLFEIIRTETLAANWVADLRPPGAADLRKMLAAHLQSASTRTVAPTTALAQANAAWDQWLESRRKEFLQAYRESLSLPPLDHE